MRRTLESCREVTGAGFYKKEFTWIGTSFQAKSYSSAIARRLILTKAWEGKASATNGDCAHESDFGDGRKSRSLGRQNAAARDDNFAFCGVLHAGTPAADWDAPFLRQDKLKRTPTTLVVRVAIFCFLGADA
jgi:hypothetical protein